MCIGVKMYKVKMKIRKRGGLKAKGRQVYFTNYESACQYCMLVGLRIKGVRV